MKVIKTKDFTAAKAWGAIDIANMGGITTRLHWTNKPYKWHINDGEEVFVVLDGQVEMQYKQEGKVKSILLNVGDIFYASIGTEHIASPVGEARILVVEKESST
jgi:mannose-6-phosphate isomerase-like protein (cupin superfamily)